MFEKEEVTEEEGEKLAKEMGAFFKLTSPKEKVGVNELFQTIGYKALAVLFPNNKKNKGESLLYHTIMGDDEGFEIVENTNIKLDEYYVKKMKVKKRC